MRGNRSPDGVAAAATRPRGPAALAAGALLLLALAAACASDPTATPQPTPTPTPPQATLAPDAPALPTATPTPAQEAWEIEWEETLARAREEGEIVVTGGGGAVRMVPWFERFSELYGINVLSSGGSTSAVANRLLAERAAGKYTVDMILGGGTVRRRLIPAEVLDPVPPELLLPDVLDLSLWQGNRHWYDPFPYVLRHSASATFYDGLMRYNTDLVTQEEIDAVNSLWDMVDPKWNGRIATLAAVSEGADVLGLNTAYHLPDLGPDFIRAFFELEDIYFAHESPILITRILLGGSDVCLFCSGTRTKFDLLAREGAPIGSLLSKAHSPDWKDTRMLDLGGSDTMVSKVNRAPHPNAVRVLINWMMSREGQLERHTLDGFDRAPEPTLRLDVPDWGNTMPEMRRVPGREYIVLEDQPGYDPDASKLFTEELYRAYVGI